MRNDPNPIFIGAKPPMNYVLAIVTQFNGGNDEIVLKARGRAISRAVDVAEIVRNRFVEEALVKDIQIGTERVANERGKANNVSSITIVLGKRATPGGAPASGAREPERADDMEEPLTATV